MANGFMGKILEVNLTTGAINKIDTDMDMARQFLGGQGFGAKYLWDRLRDPSVDPLGPDNIFMLFVGPLSGTPIPGASRFTTYCKSPITKPLDPVHPNAGSIGVATCGGWFAPELKFAGYDGIIVLGKAEKPVYLFIENDKVEIRDASHLWGKGTDETDRILRDELGEAFRFVCIGPTGEKMIPMSAVVTESSRAAGRAGTGAVMGSKNLKAIAVRGDQVVPVADINGLLQLRKHALDTVHDWNGIDNRRRYGTSGSLSGNHTAGLWATRNHREGSWDDGWPLWPPNVERSFWVRHRSCSQCPVHCMKLGVVKTGPYAGLIAEGPEYEDGTMFGSNLLINDLPGHMKLIAEADDLGFDNISVGGAIAFVFECYENGLLTKADLGGIEATWGSVDAALGVMHLIANGEGIGKYLGMGTRVAAEQIGPEALKYSMETKNHPWAAHGTQNNWKRGIMYATSNRGACHQTGENLEQQSLYTVDNSLVICRFVRVCAGGIDYYPAVVNAITGWNISKQDFLDFGDRIWNLERVYMGIQGFRRKDDYIRDRSFDDALTWGPHAGAHLDRADFEAKLDAYYEERGWNKALALPTAEKLKSLGLDFAVEELEKLG